MMKCEVVSARVTTVIPTFKRADLLRRAVASVQAQDSVSLRICIYDNASDDDTPLVAGELALLDDRIVYQRHTSNLGPVENIAYGVERVETPYFSILADDDYLLPGFYAHAVTCLDNHPGVAFCAGTTLHVRSNSVIGYNPHHLREGLYPTPAGLRRLLKEHICWNGILFRTEALSKCGFIDRRAWIWMEHDLQFRVVQEFPFYYLARPVAVWSADSDAPHNRAFHRNLTALCAVGSKHLLLAERHGAVVALDAARWINSGLRNYVLPGLLDSTTKRVSTAKIVVRRLMRSFAASRWRILVVGLALGSVSAGLARAELSSRRLEWVVRGLDAMRARLQGVWLRLRGMNGISDKIARYQTTLEFLRKDQSR